MVISLWLWPQQGHPANGWMHWKKNFTITFYIGLREVKYLVERVLHQQTSFLVPLSGLFDTTGVLFFCPTANFLRVDHMALPPPQESNLCSKIQCFTWWEFTFLHFHFLTILRQWEIHGDLGGASKQGYLSGPSKQRFTSKLRSSISTKVHMARRRSRIFIAR